MNDQLLEQIQAAGQSKVLRFWDELNPQERADFTAQLECVDWPLIGQRRNQCLLKSEETKPAASKIEPPARTISPPVSSEERTEWEQARSEGERMLHQGKVGVLLVAGGSGTRLGFQHPKGMYPIGPVTNRSLFQLFSEQILALSRRYQVTIPFLIMTGEATHADTVGWFQKHDWFGLNSQDVFFFRQGWEPALDAATGELLLAAKSSLATSADGHGGLLNALKKARLFEELKLRGIETLFYHQVDNPLVRICDLPFLGFHSRVGAQVSTKVVCKTSPDEKVGVVVQCDGRAQIIEYMDLPRDLAQSRQSDGQLYLRAGSTAIHVFQRDFLEQVANTAGGLPWHYVKRAVPFVDDAGNLIQPEKPNGLKFERFIFDVLPMAQTSLVFEISREQEFSPLKNAEGDSSPSVVRQAMTDVAAEQLRSVGIPVPDGIHIEISPLAVHRDDEPVLRRDIELPRDRHWVLGPEHFDNASG